MKTYLIGYDLNRPRGINDYPNLIAAIKSLGTWWHYLDSTWIVETSLNVRDIRDKLKIHIDGGDELLVIRVTSAWAGAGFAAKAYDWLREHIRN